MLFLVRIMPQPSLPRWPVREPGLPTVPPPSWLGLAWPLALPSPAAVRRLRGQVWCSPSPPQHPGGEPGLSSDRHDSGGKRGGRPRGQGWGKN